MKKIVAAALFACAALTSIPASADDKTITLPGYIIYGHPMRPLAVTDTGKLPMKLTLTELKQPFVSRVETPVQTAPF